MCLEKASPFTRMIMGALGGTILGIAFGLGFSFLIAFIAKQFASPQMMINGPLVDYEVPSFLGMGFGAIVGAVLGGTHANKK